MVGVGPASRVSGSCKNVAIRIVSKHSLSSSVAIAQADALVDHVVDLALTPVMLGAANGMFFAALLVMQLPVGIALDRLGPRRLVTGLSVMAVLGIVLQSQATDGTALLLARALIGIGSAASFMSAVVLCARWYGRGEMTLALSRVFALSQAGILLAGAPLAWLAGWLGWRHAFLVAALLTALVALAWWRLVRDDPPHCFAPKRPSETLIEALRGQFSIWRWSPRFGRLPPASFWAQLATVSRGCHSSGQPVSACSSRAARRLRSSAGSAGPRSCRRSWPVAVVSCW